MWSMPATDRLFLGLNGSQTRYYKRLHKQRVAVRSLMPNPPPKGHGWLLPAHFRKYIGE